MNYEEWKDVTKLMEDRRTLGLSDQLYRALGSISANLAEGYSRGTGKDRERFYEYSLGSARESRTGTTRAGVCWERASPSIAWICSPTSFGCHSEPKRSGG